LSKDIRVVLLTGAAEPVEEARSRALGIDGVLSKPFEPHVATALVRRLLTEAPIVPSFREAAANGGGPDAPAAETLKAPTSLQGGSMGDPGNVIAVDDYFRRLDEALATAGLSTAPEPAADLAATAGHRGAPDRSGDAETIIVPRPAPIAADSGAAEADRSGDASKLVDAFSALLAAEEGDGAATLAGPVEMDGAPAPAPAVEWTLGHAAAAPVESAAETVALQAVTAEAAESAANAEPQAASAPVEAAVEAPETVAAGTAAVEPATAAGPEAADAVSAEASTPAPVPTLVEAAPAAPSSPAALRADAPGQAALDGIDLDVFADAVAQKILHRLTDARIDAIVSERVLEIAERLVREEIDRIKADAQ